MNLLKLIDLAIKGVAIFGVGYVAQAFAERILSDDEDDDVTLASVDDVWRAYERGRRAGMATALATERAAAATDIRPREETSPVATDASEPRSPGAMGE